MRIFQTGKQVQRGGVMTELTLRGWQRVMRVTVGDILPWLSAQSLR